MVAKTGKDAIHITKTFDGDINLALLDIKLPDMDGGRVYPLIMEVRPDLKVLVWSGYSIDPVLTKHEEYGFRGAMAKPYQKTDLESVLKKVLG